MNKPIQLIIADFRKELSNTINDTYLPMVCITPVVKDLYEQCVLIEKEQFRQAEEEYTQNIAEENNINSNQEKLEN
ncbi:MAG: hypothetical protein K1W39_02240 [Lachnospiraceae bacterium]|jgi:hypothetical protein